MQRLGTRPGMAAQPPRERRDVIATADRVFHDGTSEEAGAPENKKSHVWVSCRAASYGDDTFRQELTGNLAARGRSEEHTSELQSQSNLVCRLLLEKKKIQDKIVSLVSVIA